jgi:hypothetical protein
MLFSMLISVKKGSDRRYFSLSIGAALCIPFFNYIWGVVHSVWVLVLYPSKNRWKNLIIIGIPVLISYALAFNSDIVDFTPQFFVALIVGLVKGKLTGGTTTDTVAGATGNIGSWGTISVGPLSVSIWQLSVLGIFVVAIITMFANIDAARQYINRRNIGDRSFIMHEVVLFSSIWYGSLLLFLLVGGNLPTIKRMIVLPGLIGVLYWVCLNSSGRKTGRAILILSLVLLVLTVPFAYERVSLNGGDKPYDIYASQNEVEKIEWVTEMDSSCLSVVRHLEGQHINKNVVAKVSGVPNIPVLYDYPADGNKVYHSGQKGEVICMKRV